MGGCQNSGPLSGPLNTRCRIYYTKDPKRDRNFDNHPCRSKIHAWDLKGLPYYHKLRPHASTVNMAYVGDLCKSYLGRQTLSPRESALATPVYGKPHIGSCP